MRPTGHRFKCVIGRFHPIHGTRATISRRPLSPIFLMIMELQAGSTSWHGVSKMTGAMLNKIKVWTLSIALAPLVSSAAFYVEPRASVMLLGEKPSIGDLGVETESDSSEFVPSLAIGIDLSSRVSLEVRYARIGEFSVRKESANFQIFPSDIVLPVIRPYELRQATDLYSVALPITVYGNGSLKLTLTPVASYETTDTEIHDFAPNTLVVVGAPPLVQRTEHEFQPGAEIALEYAFTERTAAKLHYFYSPMKNYSAHLIGAGLVVKF